MLLRDEVASQQQVECWNFYFFYERFSFIKKFYFGKEFQKKKKSASHYTPLIRKSFDTRVKAKQRRQTKKGKKT